MNIDQHILQALDSGSHEGRPISIRDLARRFGISPLIVTPAARRLVEKGLAAPTIADVRGVPTLLGLRALPRS
jgi:DNA-binding Lrp family transcriptional regulator